MGRVVLLVAALAILTALAQPGRAQVAADSEAPDLNTAAAPLFQLALSGGPAWLDVPPEANAKPAADPAPGLLHQGTWDVELSGAHMLPVRSTRDYIDSGSTALGYFIADSFSVNAAIVGYSVEQPRDDAFAAGFDLYARCYFLTLDRLTFYADIGAGMLMADEEVPQRGTHFNFTPRGGIGAGYRLTETLFLMAGLRYWHLSNAGIEGQSRNPSFDSVQYYGSIMFTF